ncbi:MAG: glycyl-radical enzyme activating protein [Deltaproteobacteria bacterium]|nr:glycyl-radical enzyme activating protein [Deltaproteobacteria bacterium]
MKALVFNIQRFSVHDGPGIRTTVFFKGCNMRCRWCENPESISGTPQTEFHQTRCIKCKLCTGRATGTDACPSGALQTIGTWRATDEIMTELLRDRDFYQESGGGVTISGGEASMQHEALMELLEILKREGIHTVLQTNGLMPREKLAALAGLVDLFHFDLKGTDPEKHRTNTGADNTAILGNATFLSKGDYPVVFRLPLIPGHNDGGKDLATMAAFLDGIGARDVDVLPYHPMGESKIDLVGMDFPKLALPAMSGEIAKEKARTLTGAYRRVAVGGDIL